MARPIIRMVVLSGTALLSIASSQSPTEIDPGRLAKVTEVDQRFESYNIEMVEVTGGRFWAPFGSGERYRMRPPLDLSAPRIRALAKALGPAYLRVSGTWANTTYIPAEGENVTAAPPGFKQVLKREQWRGVVEFAKAVDARILTSFPASDGARNPDGSWNPALAQRLIELTREAGGNIYAAEMFNEPTMPMETFPKGYSPADYARDWNIFRNWARQAAPKMLLAGPGGASEGATLGRSDETIKRGYLFSEDLLRPNPGSLDLFVYHSYGGASARCTPKPEGRAEAALATEWLDRTLIDFRHYKALRDQFEPGKPIWLNETAQAACGGSPWAATFLDSFRYLNQLGLLAQQGVQVVAHNTLAASDYALVDYDTMMPRPNYWAAVLWKRVMGRVVLSPPRSTISSLRLFAHCLPDSRGGVGLMALNIGETSQTLKVNRSTIHWVMTGLPTTTKQVLVNGRSPEVDRAGRLAGLGGIRTAAPVQLPGRSIAFFAVSGANNSACRS